MKLSIYNRDHGGLITHSTAWYDSKEQFIDYHGLPQECEIEKLAGWPDANVEWHGRTGFGF